ncbi:phosphotransferase family protein [Alteromonas sediminis]|uniref:phosphotransferase family protein n=1 Tax=Alteromonas sediminis TaxID=2259342 RepID=UPI001F0BD992|nr:phosphotransferase family protein [Alteromonas sediminis]
MTDNTLDKASRVRDGEALNIDAVNAWLQQQGITHTGLPEVTQYTGGASNWTYCLTYPDSEYILRRAPAGTKAKGAHNMEREYQLQKALKPVYPYVPDMFAFCDDPDVIGTDFYVMEKLTGIIPRKNLPRGLTITPAQTHTLCHNVLDCMIELHEVDVEAAGLTHLGKGAGYIERQIEGWNKRYVNARTWNVPKAKKIRTWLENNMPDKEHICLTHNDFRFDNVVLAQDDPTTVIGVLDWELATLGDPLMDLGNTLAYWIEADDDFFAQKIRRQPTHLPGILTREQVIDYYCEKRQIARVDFTFYEVYGLFRLAGIVQQIYYRYHHKQTNNPAFKDFWLFVHYLLWRCNKAIKRKR